MRRSSIWFAALSLVPFSRGPTDGERDGRTTDGRTDGWPCAFYHSRSPSVGGSQWLSPFPLSLSPSQVPTSPPSPASPHCRSVCLPFRSLPSPASGMTEGTNRGRRDPPPTSSSKQWDGSMWNQLFQAYCIMFQYRDTLYQT